MLHCDGELLALRLEVGADLGRSALSVTRRHGVLIASVVSFASWIACSGTGGEPFLRRPIPRKPSSAARTPSPTVTTSRASHVARNVASAAAIVANRKP